ncbi:MULTISPECIES: hypothetical protein [Gracilimonas]|uniref:Uncharacterized protein n=1 Tax=Gracilimonas sediminicola TaxID=2952158 RepID=A0A9X2RE90_9BACT|nr:hypothetical protein [Gracilimonas sediminicola]MCP9290083.1 hypothetical protein [Gracilimonas sediminicola]
MNIGIVTSYVIGGFMLISILAFNISLNTTGQETTISTINQEKRDNLVELISCDFNGLGYSDDVFNNEPIATSERNRIEFRTSPACVDNGDNTSGELVTLYADSTAFVSSTTNPNDFYLYREDKNGTTRFLVTYFKLKYYKRDVSSGNWEEQSDPAGSGTSQRGIKVRVEIMIESEEPIRISPQGDYIYHRTAWTREFLPNIMNHPWN